MDKRTVFAITFFLLSLIVLLMAYEGAPEHYGGSKYQTPAPKTVEVGKMNFTFPAGYFEEFLSSMFFQGHIFHLMDVKWH